MRDKGVPTTDEAAADQGRPALCHRHGSVQHSAGEYIRAMAHANGMEAFRSRLQRGHMGGLPP